MEKSSSKERKKIMKKSHLLSIASALMLLFGFSMPAVAAEAPIIPGGPFINPNQEVSTASVLTFEEIEATLFNLEARSRGQMTVETVGYTILGEPLYAARLGHGDRRVWIQGRIHGGERYGAEASLALLSSLLSSNENYLDEITFLIIPCYNPDGSNLGQRGNANRVDLNRDWWRGTVANSYTQPESQAFYSTWIDFKPHFAIDLHWQGTYFVEDTNKMSALSIGIPVAGSRLDPPIWDAVRQMAVVGYDAVSALGYGNPTRYPFIDIPNSAEGSMLLGGPGPDGNPSGWKTAAMFFEERGDVGQKSRGYRIRQFVVIVTAIIDAIASGELENVNPELWDEIPLRPTSIRTSDKWPNLPDEWMDEWVAE
jgi:hypothetical protein